MPESTSVAIAFVEFLNRFELDLNHRQEDHLGNAITGFYRE